MNNPAYLTVLSAIRVILGVIFLYAGIVKSLDTQSFADGIYAFRILPSQLINPIAMTLPMFEIIIGCMLVMGWAVRVAILGASFLLAIFSIALGQALIRGLNVDCACFGPEKTSFWRTGLSLMRDAVLLVGSILLRVKSKTERF
jgi:uncharacterized membrane protein YphA (DoxX/SURF4 family)